MNKRGRPAAVAKKPAVEKTEEEIVEEPEQPPQKKPSNNPIGRPKGEKKLDLQFKKKADQIKTTIATVQKLVSKGKIKEEDAEDEIKDAIKELFEDDFDDQGEGIMNFLTEKRERQEDSVRDKNEKFTASLAAFKEECTLDKVQDNFIASIRKADLAKLGEHERFFDVGHLALNYYKEVYDTEKTDEAKDDAVILSALREIKDSKRKSVFDTSKFASADSQAMDDDN